MKDFSRNASVNARHTNEILIGVYSEFFHFLIRNSVKIIIERSNYLYFV